MTTFIALYRGKSVGSAQLIAVSADVLVVASAAKGILGEVITPIDGPILEALERRRQSALRLIARVDEGQTQKNSLREDGD